MANKENLLNPKASPSSASSGTKTVNKKPLYMIIGIVAVVLMMFIYTVASKSQKEAKDPPQTDDGVAYSANTDSLINGINDGVIAPDPTPIEPVETVPPLINGDNTTPNPGIPTTASLETPPLPGVTNSPIPSQQNFPSEEACDQVCQIKAEMFQRAVMGGTTVSYSPPTTSTQSMSNAPTSRQEMIDRMNAVQAQLASANQGATDPNAVYQQQLAQLQAQQPGGSPGSGDGALFNIGNSSDSSSNSTDGAYSQFSGSDERWKLNSVKKALPSPYSLLTGAVLPATLISGINSELPGTLNAQVSQNVYDTATGKYLLIPQGSRLVGAYSNDVIYGQSRVLIAWQRIIFPDGGSLDIGSMPGADSAGYSGFNDKVNNHYFRIFASAFLLSGITATVAFSQDHHSNHDNNNNNNDDSFSSEMSRALGQQMGQVTAQLIMKNLNIAPTLEIRPGYQFNVIVTKDLIFSKPYKPFEY